jgi:hypothetical protein
LQGSLALGTSAQEGPPHENCLVETDAGVRWNESLPQDGTLGKPARQKRVQSKIFNSYLLDRYSRRTTPFIIFIDQ